MGPTVLSRPGNVIHSNPNGSGTPPYCIMGGHVGSRRRVAQVFSAASHLQISCRPRRFTYRSGIDFFPELIVCYYALAWFLLYLSHLHKLLQRRSMCQSSSNRRSIWIDIRRAKNQPKKTAQYTSRPITDPAIAKLHFPVKRRR